MLEDPAGSHTLPGGSGCEHCIGRESPHLRGLADGALLGEGLRPPLALLLEPRHQQLVVCLRLSLALQQHRQTQS